MEADDTGAACVVVKTADNEINFTRKLIASNRK